MKFASVSNARIDDSGSSDGGVNKYNLSSLLCCEWFHNTFGRPTTVLLREFFFPLDGFDRSPADGGVDADELRCSNTSGYPLFVDPPPLSAAPFRTRFLVVAVAGARFVPREAAIATNNYSSDEDKMM